MEHAEKVVQPDMQQRLLWFRPGTYQGLLFSVTNGRVSERYWYRQGVLLVRRMWGVFEEKRNRHRQGVLLAHRTRVRCCRSVWEALGFCCCRSVWEALEGVHQVGGSGGYKEGDGRGGPQNATGCLASVCWAAAWRCLASLYSEAAMKLGRTAAHPRRAVVTPVELLGRPSHPCPLKCIAIVVKPSLPPCFAPRLLQVHEGTCDVVAPGGIDAGGMPLLSIVQAHAHEVQQLKELAFQVCCTILCCSLHHCSAQCMP